jgi:hypothetical protein
MTATTDRTVDEYITWVNSHPTRHQGGPWALADESYCEQLVNNAGDFPDSFDTAALAAAASGKLDKSKTNIKVGEFLYWTNHVGLYIGGGTMICASTMFAGAGKTGVGKVAITTWQKRFPAQKWLGHTFRHGTHELKDAQPTPIPPDPTDAHNKGARLATGANLGIDDYLANKGYRMRVTSNGHVIVDLVRTDGTRRKYTSVSKKAAADQRTMLTLQADGNLVVYGYNSKGARFAVWNTRTNGKKFKGATLALGVDGTLTLIPLHGTHHVIHKG